MDFYTIQQAKHGRKNHYTPIRRRGFFGLGSALSAMSNFEYLRILTLRTIGNFLVLFSLYMLSWVFYKPVVEEIKYAYNNAIGRQYVVAEEYNPTDAQFTTSQGIGERGLLSEFLGTQKIEPLIPKDPYFSIVIPKLGANANIISNVNAASENDYMAALRSGVAHAAGSAYPGQDKHVYLFAHSTNTFSNVSRYNAIFYLLYKLEAGDEVNIYYNGIRYKYSVTGKVIVDPSEVQYLTRNTESEFLTLQTCWPPGTVAKRMLVFAEPVVR